MFYWTKLKSRFIITGKSFSSIWLKIVRILTPRVMELKKITY